MANCNLFFERTHIIMTKTKHQFNNNSEPAKKKNEKKKLRCEVALKCGIGERDKSKDESCTHMQ